MSRVFITGSTDGLGFAAARALIDHGHVVVLHGRSRERAVALADLAKKSLGIVLRDRSAAVQASGPAFCGATGSSGKPGQLVTREELQNRLWPADTYVEFDGGIYNAMERLRSTGAKSVTAACR